MPVRQTFRQEHCTRSEASQQAVVGKVDASHGRSTTGFRSLMQFLMVAAVGFVFWRAWVCDDAFITFRHVENCLAGYGPVFNVGERVQGFTHPLWFLWLLVGTTLFDPYAVAVFGGLLCTGLLVWILARGLRRYDHSPLLLLVGITLLLSSRSFVEFQTSGLETPLADVLIVVLFVIWPLTVQEASRNSRVVASGLVCSLLLMTRLDLVFICGPVLACAALRAVGAGPRVIGRFVLAMLPALGWYAFATLYYGTPLPNTAYAKLAFPPTLALVHGVHYLLDYAVHEPVHALLIVATPVVACGWRFGIVGRMRFTWAGLCLPAGVLLHLAYIVAVGGDFMRGRFVVPALVAAVVLGCRILGHILPSDVSRPLVRWLVARRPVALGAIAIVLAGVASLYDSESRIPSPEQITSDGGIADEYAWYAGYWNRPRFRLPESAPNHLLVRWVTGGQLLRRYSREHGAITIVWGVMGIMPYHAGPQVSVIDALGLTDAYVARCPADPYSRVGHIGHDVPLEYYQWRGAVNTLPGALERIETMDPSLVEEALLMQQHVIWSDREAELLLQNVRLVTSGPIFSWERLKAIPAYAFPRRREFTRSKR